MPVLRHQVLFASSTTEGLYETVFSSATNLSCINSRVAIALTEAQPLGRTRWLATNKEAEVIKVTHRITLDFYIDDVLLSDEFLVVPGLSEEVIIGAATMQKGRIKLNFEDDRVEVDPKVAKMQLI